ncbi:hypothetical protein [Deinococcus maricopensis]|uniref:hypothetical protein n=1 Tax=Deinococcus maricopensis TaxID=309887 RepID=UPI0002E62320|nr:hypothetical protein [Deinococcus maricopensis]
MQSNFTLNSALTRWSTAGATLHGHGDDDLPALIAAARLPDPAYVHPYVPAYDAICHRFGPSSAEAAAHLADTLPRDHRTLLLITADHGRRDLHPAALRWPTRTPELTALLSGVPFGEERVTYLNVPERHLTQVRALLTLHAHVYGARDLWNAGLFGPPRSSFRARTGNLIAVARDDQTLGRTSPVGHMFEDLWGLHGGWSSTEMLVPVIALTT